MVAIKGKKEKKAVIAKPFKEENRVSKKKGTALLGAKKLKHIVELTEKQCTPVVEEVKQLKTNGKVENKIKAKKNKHHIKNLDGVEIITANKGSKLGNEKSIESSNGWEVSSLHETKSQAKGRKSKKKNANFQEKNSKTSVTEEDVSSVEVNIKMKGKNKMEKKRKKSESADDNVSLPDKGTPRKEGKKIRIEKQVISEDKLDDDKENQAEQVQESTGRNKKEKLKGDSNNTYKKKKSTYLASLSYEDLVEGQLMLGCIQKIDNLQLVISLPHGALGNVVITRICNAYTELLQKFTEENDNEKSSVDIKPLQNLFTVGNHVVVRIVEVLKEGDKAKVSLSLKPEDVNSDLSVSLLKVGHVLQCVVSGIDSKGFIIDTGIPGVSRAFLPKKSAEETDILDVGSMLRCIVTKIQETKAKGTISLTVSADSRAVRDAALTVDSATHISQLVPGTTVDTTVSKVHKDRLDLDLANLKGVVNRRHLKKIFDTLDCYKKGMKVRARVLYNSLEKKMVHLTLQDHVCLDSSETSVLKAGDEIENAEVFENGSLGVFWKLNENCLGFSTVNDDSTADEFTVGSQRCCRIVKYLPMDNLYNVICKKEKTTLLIREKVNAVVKEIKEESIIVTLKKPSIDAQIPLCHLHDNASKWDEVKSSFRVGDDVHGAVVFSITDKLVTLTLKKSLKSWITKSKLSHQINLTESVLYPGIVRKVSPYGILVVIPVGRYGFHGLIHYSQLKDIWDMRNLISEGATIWVIYGGVDDKRKKIFLYAKDKNDTQEILQNKEGKLKRTQEKKTEEATIDTDDSAKKKRKCKDTENQVENKKFKDAEKTKACHNALMSEGLLDQTVLGRIEKIENDKMDVSLPQGHIGTVPATKICNAYTELLKKLANQEIDDRAATITSLQDLFAIGKHVIVKVAEDQNEESSKTVSFSLKPEDVNSKLSASFLKVGHVLPCAVSEVEKKGFVIDTGILGVNKAFLPIKAAEGAGIVGVGSLLQCMVTKIQGDKAKGTVKLIMSADPKTINNATLSGDLADVSLLIPGTPIDATVSKVQDDGLELSCSNCKAFVSYIHLKGLFDTVECYKEGMNVKAWVLFVSRETKIVHCTLQDRLFSQSFDDTVFPGLKIGEEVKQAEVYGSSKFGVFLKLNETCRGYSKLTNHDSMDAFAVGTKKYCIILNYSFMDNLYTVNLKKEKPKLYVRSQVNGVIKKIEEDAIIVALENVVVDAKLPIYHLHDEVNKWDEIKSSLEVGDHIQGAVIFSNSKDGITLTLKTSIKNWIASTNPGQQMVLAESLRYPGVVEEVRPYGIVCEVPVGVTGYHGLLHKSQLKRIWQRKNSVSVGATVWVKYKGVDDQGRPSLVYANNKNETLNMLQLCSSEDRNKTGMLETRLKGTENQETNEEGNEDKQDIENDEEESKPRISQPKQCLTVGGGFVWDIPDTAAEKEESSDSDEEDGEAQKKKAKKLTKAEQIALAKQEEQRLFELERARLDKDRVPENAMDYEELLQMSPNSSAVWIKYISYHLESAEVEKAKSIARRALTVINMSEERERLNIWTVILRLEVLYGTSESTEAAFKEALLGNDSQKIHEAMAMVYAESEKTEEAGKVYHAMTKKFGKDINVWIKVAVFYYQNQKLDQGRHLLDRALLPLEKKDHVELISRFAQLEFKFGEPERGKSMFESLVSNHPKRIDIWSVYIDVLTKNRNFEGARDVLGRMMGLNLRMNKMRAIFKKCLDFESVHGTPETVNAVKTQVQEYLSGTLGSS